MAAKTPGTFYTTDSGDPLRVIPVRETTGSSGRPDTVAFKEGLKHQCLYFGPTASVNVDDADTYTFGKIVRSAAFEPETAGAVSCAWDPDDSTGVITFTCSAANQTGWYFGADVSQVQTGIVAGPGISTGYTFVNEAPETIAAGAGLFGLFGLGPVIPFGVDGSLEGGEVLSGGGPFFIGAPLLMGAPLAFGGAPLFESGIGPGAALGIGGGGAIEGGFIPHYRSFIQHDL